MVAVTATVRLTVPAVVPVLPASAVPTVTASQMAEVDRSAIEGFGVTLLQMMEQAGVHLAEVARLEVGGGLSGRRVVVVVGPGNNGGGGLVAARHIANRGGTVRVVLARPALRMSAAAQHQLATLIAMGTECCVLTYDLSDAELERLLATADLIVDAVLGYNVQGAPRAEEGRLIELSVRSGRPVASLDLPSGVDPDSGASPGAAITATATLTLALPKLGLFQGEGRRLAGRVYLGDLGLPEALYTGLGISAGLPFSSGALVLLDRDA